MSPKGRLKNLIQLYEPEKNIPVRVNSDNDSPRSKTSLGYVSRLTEKMNCEILNEVSDVDLICNQMSGMSNRIKSYKFLTIRTNSFINENIRNYNVTRQDNLNNSKDRGFSKEDITEKPNVEYKKVAVKQAVLKIEHQLTLSKQNAVIKTSNHNGIKLPENSKYNINHYKPKKFEQTLAFSEGPENTLEDIQKIYESKNDSSNQVKEVLNQKQITTTSIKQNTPNKKVIRGLVVLSLRKGDTARKKRKPTVVRLESEIDIDCAINETGELASEIRDGKTTTKIDDIKIELNSTKINQIEAKSVVTEENTFAIKEAIEMIKGRDFQITAAEQPYNQQDKVSSVTTECQSPNEKGRQIKNIGDILNPLSPSLFELQDESKIDVAGQLTLNTENKFKETERIRELFGTILNVKK